MISDGWVSKSGYLLSFIFISCSLQWLFFALYFILSKCNAMPCISSYVNKDKSTQCAGASNRISEMRKDAFNHQQFHFSSHLSVSVFTSVLYHAVSYSFFFLWQSFMVLCACCYVCSFSKSSNCSDTLDVLAVSLWFEVMILVLISCIREEWRKSLKFANNSSRKWSSWITSLPVCITVHIYIQYLLMK